MKFIIMIVTMLMMSCATTDTKMMTSGRGAPASQGYIKVSEAENGNVLIEISVKHLAPPSKMSPDATTYVVWLQPRGGQKQNIGSLTLNEDLEGSITTISPHKTFTITITPEPSGQVSYPTHEPVFTADVNAE